jgi:hypothetical protein
VGVLTIPTQLSANVVKLGQLLRRLKGNNYTHRQHGDVISLLTSLEKGKWAK